MPMQQASKLTSENIFLKVVIFVLFVSNFFAYYLVKSSFHKDPVVIRVDKAGRASALAISYRQMQRQDEREIKAFAYQVFTRMLDLSPGSYEKNVAWVANHMTTAFREEYLKAVEKQVPQIKKAKFLCEVQVLEDDLKIVHDSENHIEVKVRALRVIVDKVTKMRKAEAVISQARFVRCERTIENPHGLLLEDSKNEKFIPIDIDSARSRRPGD